VLGSLLAFVDPGEREGLDETHEEHAPVVDELVDDVQPDQAVTCADQQR